MTEKKKVVVNINSQEYTVVSVELEAYIKKISKCEAKCDGGNENAIRRMGLIYRVKG